MAQRAGGDGGWAQQDEMQRLALQNLYLGSRNLAPVAPPTHQHELYNAGLPFALRTEDLAQHNSYPYPYSTPEELSLSPSASSRPIDLSSRAAAAPSFDSNSFDAFEPFDSLVEYEQAGAYTPSYGSWQSSYADSFPSTHSRQPSYSESVPSSRHSSASDAYRVEHQQPQFQYPPPPQTYQPYPSPTPYSAPQGYRDASFDQWSVSDASGGRVSASPEWSGRMDGCEDDSAMSDGRGHSGSQQDKDATLTPSDRQRQREQRQRQLQQLQQQAGMTDAWATGANVLASHLSESPPTASNPFETTTSRASPALAPLAIPTGGPTPSLNLTEPTPATARPRPVKSQGTLDLERAFEMLVHNESLRGIHPHQHSPQPSHLAYPAPPASQQHASPQPAFAPQFVNAPDQPRGYHSSTAHLRPSFEPPFAHQTAYGSQPSHRRSKSETYMPDGPTPYDLTVPTFGTSSAANHQFAFPRPSHADEHPPPMAPAESQSFHWPSPTEHARSDDQQSQREFSPRQKSSVQSIAHKFAGGPGYESGLTQPVGASEGSHRRARSQGTGHRSSRSEDVATYAYSVSTIQQRQDGHLAPPTASGFAAPPPPHAFAQPPPAGYYASTSQQQAQSNQLGTPQRTPYVYHSPVASPDPVPAQRLGSVSDAESQDERDLQIESKTTPATIEAAQRRRNPGVAARFVCELCGETFTRRYNLRGHQRAHRNEKPYACSYEGCEKAFARAHDCKRHELLHLGVRRYHCDPCQRDFVRLDALQRHHRSEIGQVCVNQLREAGFVIGYDTSAGVGLEATGGALL